MPYNYSALSERGVGGFLLRLSGWGSAFISLVRNGFLHMICALSFE